MIIALNIIWFVTCFGLCFWINHDWSNTCREMNAGWYMRISEIMEEFSRVTKSMSRRIDELEEKINELSKKQSESLTHFENDADKG